MRKLEITLKIRLSMRCTNCKNPSSSLSLDFWVWSLDIQKNGCMLIFAVILCGHKNQRLSCKKKVGQLIGIDKSFGELEVFDFLVRS